MGKIDRLRILAGLAISIALTGAAGAQVRQINMGANMDANPAVGSGGSNQPVQGYVPINGNDVITGNVPGLQYFHGSPAVGGGTPVTSQYQFQGGTNSLGTSSLNSFARQSAGNGMGGGSALNNVYYLPSSTVSSAQGGIYSAPIGSGFDSNLVPRTSLSPVATSSQIQALDPGATTSGSAAFSRINAAETPTDAGSPGAVLSSPIFALREMPQLTPDSDTNGGAGKTPGALKLPGNTGDKSDQSDMTNGTDTSATAQPDLRLGKSPDAVTSTDQEPKDARIGDSYQALLDQLKKAETDAKAADNDTATAATPGGKGATVRGTNMMADDVDPLTGRTRRTALLKKPGAATQPNSQGIGAAIMAEDELKKEAMPAKALEDLPTSTLQAGAKLKPMSSLVRVQADGKTTPVEVLMTQAEKLLKDGKYLEAAERYQTALAREPGNALALVGRAHAELGAGMYQSAAYDLKYVFTRNPQMISVRYEMDQFIPKTRQDYLVSDLQTLEASKETGNTASFLLSYLYYETGRMEQLRGTMTRWNSRPAHDAWQTVLNKAWSSNAPAQ